MNWFRLYHDVLTDPKVQRLSIELRWRWVELLCVASRERSNGRRAASKRPASGQRAHAEPTASGRDADAGPRRNDGRLPDIDVITYHLRVSRARAKQIIQSLVDVGLIDETEDGQGFRMHNWEERQRKSDSSAGRVAAFRERHGNDSGNEDVTLQKRSRGRARAGVSELELERENCADGPPGFPAGPRLPDAPGPGEAPEPEYPDPDRSPLMIAPGPFEMPEGTARELWSLLWRGWGDMGFLADFYQHQRFYRPESWREAIRVVASRAKRPNSIGYFEAIAAQCDAKGLPEHHPRAAPPRASPPAAPSRNAPTLTDEQKAEQVRKLKELRDRRGSDGRDRGRGRLAL